MSKVAKTKLTIPRWRFLLVLSGLALLPAAAIWHIAGLQVMPDADRGYEFLQGQSIARTVRTQAIPHRCITASIESRALYLPPLPRP